MSKKSGNITINIIHTGLMKISLKVSLTLPNLAFLRLTWSTTNAEGGGGAIEGGGGGKDVYLNNFIIYHHFVQCPPKTARKDHYLWLSDSVFFSNNHYFWLLEISKF